MLLDQIHSPGDLKQLDACMLAPLCDEIREVLIDTISKNGGHLASNLGVVELTVALHRVFDSPRDAILFDVGHQCYTHKLLTGRLDRFSTIRTEGGLSGFLRPEESEHDPFISGHSSMSVSAGFGISQANALLGRDGYVVDVVGDGALTGGMIFEAFNNAGRSRDKLIVILNDNKMSISRNVGSLARYLAGIRSRTGYVRAKNSLKRGLSRIPLVGPPLRNTLYKSKTLLKNMIYNSNLFESMGFYYLGPVDGHNLAALTATLETAKQIQQPVLVHVCTVKGKGYSFAEKNPRLYHGISGFDVETGDCMFSENSFSAKFGEYLCSLAVKDEKICAITAAMTEGTGLKPFRDRFKSRFYDVGIAEEHAVSFAAGLASRGLRPVFAVYSSFLQRGYDQIIHDTAICGQNVLFAVDRAGIVGEDGETHQGVFDVSFLNSVPNLAVYAPACYADLRYAVNNALYRDPGPAAVRYPRGAEPELPDDFTVRDEAYSVYGDSAAPVALLTYGRLFATACQALGWLKLEGIDACVYKLNRIKPLPEGLAEAAAAHEKLFFFEESLRSGGVGEHFAAALLERGYRGAFHLTAVPDEFVAQSTVARALEKYGLDCDGMVQTVREGCR